MKGTMLHWLAGPWPGKLAMSARPRGGDWLEDELSSWRSQGVDSVLSLLTNQEEIDLDLLSEAPLVHANGMHFFSFPIEDRQVPDALEPFLNLLELLEHELGTGRNLLLHCRQGIGRTGLVAACLLVAKGATPQEAIETLSAIRGLPVPETPGQRDWIERFSRSFSSVHHE